MKKRIIQLIFILTVVLCSALLTAGCSHKLNKADEQSRFDTFLKDVFVLEVQADTLSLNYSLAIPENYGISGKKTTLGEYSVSHMNEDLSVTENYLYRLMTFDYKLLTPDQQLTYHILKSYLEQDISLGSFLYYHECLGPTTGIQAQLPILLAEYNFYSREDIDEYLRLLPCVYDYFKGICEYEREKSERGLFMNDSVAVNIIKQCQAFINNPEGNFLIEYFNEKNSYCFLSRF
jgi:uncharacterized protein (DUF885 family)